MILTRLQYDHKENIKATNATNENVLQTTILFDVLNMVRNFLWDTMYILDMFFHNVSLLETLDVFGRRTFMQFT